MNEKFNVGVGTPITKCYKCEPFETGFMDRCNDRTNCGYKSVYPPQNPLLKGRKDNKEKLQMARFYKHFPNAIKGLFEVASFGAKKYNEPYEEINWKSNSTQDYEDALLRHLHEYLLRNLTDNETGLPHLYHLLWNIAVLIELEGK